VQQVGWRVRGACHEHLPINEMGTATTSTLIHEPNNRCFVDVMGLNLDEGC